MFLTSNLKKSAKCLPAVKYYDTVTWRVWAIKPYVNIVKFLPPQDYELQLMTYKAFVESQQKSPGKRRRMLSSSDAITQEVKGGEGHKPLSSLKEDSFVWALQFDLGLTFPLSMWLHENFLIFSTIFVYFLAENLSKLFFRTIVHGLKDSLHSIGDLNNSACKVYQWCAPAAGRGGGEDSWILNHLENENKNPMPIYQNLKYTQLISLFTVSCSTRLL